MLPSLGYFRGTECPFFANGLCQRPYCHFRHVKKDGQLQSTTLLDVIWDDSTTSSLDINGKKQQSSINKSTNITAANTEFTYVPTPLSECNKEVPEYDPTDANTPLEEAITYSGDQTTLTEYKPSAVTSYKPTPVQKNKKKHSHTYSISHTKNVSDLEYDPMSNFCTPMTPRKTKSTGSAVSDFAEEPKFSDGEEELVEGDSTSQGQKTDTTDTVSEMTGFALTNILRVECTGASVNSVVYVDKADTTQERCNQMVSEELQNDNDKVKSTSQNITDKKHRKVSDKESQMSNDGNIIKERSKLEGRKDKNVFEGKKDGNRDGIKKQKKHALQSSGKNIGTTKTESRSGKQSGISHEKEDLDTVKKTSKLSFEPSSGKDGKKKCGNLGLPDEKCETSLPSTCDGNVNKTVQICKPVQKRKRSAAGCIETVTPLSKKKRIQTSEHRTSTQMKSKSHISKKSQKQIDCSMKDGKSSRKKDKSTAHNLSSKSNQAKKKKNSGRKMQKQRSVDLFGEDSDIDSDMIKEDCDKRGKKNKHNEHQLCDDSDVDVGKHSSESDTEHFANMIDESDLEALTEHDTYEECLQIFNDQTQKGEEAVKAETKKKSHQCNSSDGYKEKKTLLETEESSSNVRNRQRIAHQAKFDSSSRLKKIKVNPHIQPTPAQVCHNRYLAVQKHMEEQMAVSSRVNLADKSPRMKTSSQEDTTKNNQATKNTTFVLKKESQTLSKTHQKNEKRKAHVPKVILASKPRPIIPVEYGSKVPANIRQRYLNTFIDECLKFCQGEEEAYSMALTEEKTVYQRCSSRNVYLNLCINTVKRLRSLQPQSTSEAKSPTSPRKTISHEAVLGGKKATLTTFTVHRSGHHHISSNLKFEGAELYERLKPYILSEQQLQENGFPRPSPGQPGLAVITQEQKKQHGFSDSNQRICDRCGKTYLVRAGGQYITKEECIYHWGRLWKKRTGGMIESRYSCCQGDVQSKGCCVCKCYTTIGLELTRVTVTDEKCEEVYDTLVKPVNPIIDYNTRFSGITEEDLKSVSTILHDVQAVLLNKFSADTILIGHSLESDLLALKMVHGTVIDTSVVFPHKQGPPYKRALRTLMAEYLNKIIQNDASGHDSKEDANSCMQLMIWKVKEDAKTKKYF
ncbi:RNA exonuclease 1 homolog isoform X2 [Ptychodera flava]|uniref:RNA exonuclease 1 homolog isoform X2 n=1 Tax=Ptychodera flava TaxID=63121 RepID=UPI00396A915C